MTGTQNVNNILILYHLITLAVLTGIAIYDIKHHLILNTVMLPFFLWGLTSIPVRHMCCCISYTELLTSSLTGCLLGSGLLLTIALFTNGGIGGGDIKLTAVLGFIIGSWKITCLLFTAASIAAIFMLFIHFITKKAAAIPFAPFLLVGYMLQLFV